MHDQSLTGRRAGLDLDPPRRKARRKLLTLSRQDAARLGRLGRIALELAAVVVPFGFVAAFLLSL